nr:dual specificity protein phosphatase family protein [uncultured Brevundimonas sp.]
MIVEQITPRRRPGWLSLVGRIAVRLGLLVAVLIAVAIVYVGVTAMNGNFHTVAEGEVYRSAQPSPAALERYVRRHGIRTVINLRGENPADAWYQDEVTASRRLGLNHIDFRMSARRGISRREAWRLIQIMQRATKPILIHCESGADRTGLASALYVAAVQRRGESAAEEQLSLKYGHIAAPFGKGWGMTVTFEEMEPSLGFIGS